MAWLLSVVLFVLPACRASPVAIDIGRQLVDVPNSTFRAHWPYVIVEVGTPPQEMKMVLNTDAADILVVQEPTPGCGPTAAAGTDCSWGIYHQNASTTSVFRSNQNLTDGTTSYGNGSVVEDTLTFGNMSFPRTTIVVRDSQDGQDWPIFGVGGYSSQELVTPRYSNLPITLDEDNATNINGYSLYFQHINATTSGRLVFGGIELSKFTGTLETLQIPQDMTSLSYGETMIPLSNMLLSDRGTQTSIDTMEDVKVVISAADTGIGLPSSALQQLLSLLNLTNYRSLTAAEFGWDIGTVFPYEAIQNETTIDLQFRATTIQIPIWDMLLPFNTTHGFIELWNTTKETTATPVLGACFFSNAYTVFDFSHNQVSLAPLRHEALSDDNVTPIEDTGVAGLTGTAVPSNSSLKSGLSTGAKIGIGVGVSIATIFVVGLVVFFICRSRRSPKAPDVDAAPSKSDYPGYRPAPGARKFVAVEMEANEIKPAILAAHPGAEEEPKRKSVALQELP